MKTKKELKAEYNLMKMRAGVFQIRNTQNNKVYIDSSTNLDKIWNRHRVELNYTMHRNEKLQQEWNTFGEANFCFEILSEIKEPEKSGNLTSELKELTKLFIEERQPFGENGYH